jgi:hypothetical protein
VQKFNLRSRLLLLLSLFLLCYFFLKRKMALNISDAIKIYGHPLTSVELTEKLDENDNLSKFRQEFVIPTLKSLSEVTGTRYTT